MTEPAVEKSFRAMEIPIEIPSNKFYLKLSAEKTANASDQIGNGPQ